MKKKNILLIGGSLNQTTMMYKIAQHLTEYNCFYTPFYAGGLLQLAAQHGLFDRTVLGGKHLSSTAAFLLDQNLPVDLYGQARKYDLVLTGTDLILPKNISGSRLVLVQEGITEEEDIIYHLVKKLKLPRFLANTSATGLSDAYQKFCVASNGYRNLFIRKGVKAEKIAVTGIPNFDNIRQFTHNDFPQHGYVLAATTALRESMRYDDRPAFIGSVVKLAAGRPIIFKLHPLENPRRAIREIRSILPEGQIFTDGDINPMIANCDLLVTQTSTVTFVGLALGKEVYSYRDLNQLRELLPIQNGGKSAENIAGVCRRVLNQPQPQKTPLPKPSGFGAKNSYQKLGN
jgi:hypothetical protein